ncbi:MAG: tRNA (N(6)-L-threonylcarbamoyladenosine(37)-C(2))-methylthiotransferase MtaB, partial [bacterium]
MTTVSAVTLGCKVNQAESDGILESFRRRGYLVYDAPENSDVVILNTCAVTLEGERKSLKSARRLKRLPHKPCVIVTGCFATLQPDEAEATEADLVVGNHEKSRIVEFYESLVSRRDAR